MDTETPPLILVPLDGSPLAEQAIPYAAATAGPDHELLLLRVAPAPEPARDYYTRRRLPMTEQDLVKYEGSLVEELTREARRWADVAPRVRARAVTGDDPAEQLLKVAIEERVDLIVMASHGRGALGRWTFGSVADRVARSSPVPVMIVRPQDAAVEIGEAEVFRFVVPLDGSELAASALPVAERLARRTHRPVHLIRVIPPVTEVVRSEPASGGLSPEVTHDVYASIEANAGRPLAEIAQRLQAAGIPTTWEILVGAPDARIVDATHPGDVVVISSHGRGGIRRWLIGSVAEKLVRLARGPVVVVRASQGEAMAEAAD